MKKKIFSGVLFIALLVPSIFIISRELERLKLTLQHRSVKSVAPRLMEELTTEGQISLDTKRNTLTVMDEPPVVEKIGKMVADLDVPARRFAVSTTLAVFAEKSRSLFKEDERLTDIADFMDKAKPAERFEGVLDLYEGKSGGRAFGKSYFLSVTLGGYDPWERKLNFEDISVEKRSGSARVMIFRGNANLAEGAETSIVIPSKGDIPAVSLAVNPTLLPNIEKKREIP